MKAPYVPSDLEPVDCPDAETFERFLQIRDRYMIEFRKWASFPGRGVEEVIDLFVGIEKQAWLEAKGEN